MMRDSKSSDKKPIQEVQAPRSRKSKLERFSRNTTEYKKAEGVLRSERNSLISIFEAMADGVYIVNQEYDIEYVNPVLEKDFGAWEGRKCYEYFHDRKESCSWCKNKDVFAGKTVRWEWYSFKNRRTYDLIDTPLKNPDGSLSKLEIFRDITDRKRVEEKLKASELRFRSLIEQTTDAVFCYEYDPPIPTDLPSRKQVKLLYKGLLVECNDVCAKSYGARRAEEVIGKRLTELFKTMPGSLDKLFRSLIDGDYRIVDGEGVEKFEDGTERYYLNNGHGIIEDGKLVRVWGTFRDITESKKVQEQLKQSTEFLANTINALDDTFFVKDQEHRWAALNDAACEAIGRPREELIGKSDYDCFPKEQADKFWEKDNLVLETGETNVTEEEVTWRGKVHTISTKKSLFTDSIAGKRFIVGTARDITEHKKADESLQESEQKYRALIEQSLHGIVIFQDYRIVFANKAACEIPGLTMEKLLALSTEDMLSFIPPENRSTIRKRLQDRFAGRDVPQNYELRLIRKKGEEFWLNMSFSTIEFQGRPAFQLAFTDITERLQAQKQLKQSKEFLDNIINALDDPVFVKDEKHRWAVLNNAACEVMGCSREELIGKSDYDLFAKEQADVFWERDNLVLKNGVTDVNEEEITWHGKLHTISTKKSVYTDSITGKKFIAGTIRDITNRKKAEDALTESEEKFRNLAEQSPNMIFINKRGRVVYANEKCEEDMGYKREEFYHPDFDFMALIAPEFRQLIKTNLNRHMNGEKIKPYEYGLITKDGDRLDAIITTKLIKYDGIDSILGTITDITERKKAQEEIARLAKFPAEDPNPVLRISKDGTILYANDASSIVMDTWERKIGERLPKACFERAEEVFRTGTASTFEFDCNNGQIFEVKLAPIVESGYANAYGLDITERKRAEEALTASESKYRSLFDNSMEGIGLSKGNCVISANKSLLDIFGYDSIEEFSKIPLLDHVAPESREMIRELIKKREKGELEPSSRFEHKILRKDGQIRDLEISRTAMSIEGEQFTQSTFRDITERKQAEEKLHDYQEQLKSLASQLTLAEERERRRIAIELHDEISQSLFISKMKLESLDKSTSDKKHDDTLDEINNSLGRIIAAMRSLTFDLSSPILYEFGFEEAVAEWLNEQVEKKHGIATELEDDGLPKQLDDDIRVILFRNVRELLINVVKHARAKKVKVSIQKVDNRIRISVEDDGVGFESARAESLITKKEAFGLFSIRERLESLGGNLDIKSSPGCGSRITITSPLSRENIREDKEI